MKNRVAFVIKQAFYKSIPVLAGYIILGFGFGILLQNAGCGVPWSFAMSCFIYAGSIQCVGMSLITGSVIGNLLGSVLPFSTDGIEFSMTALFAASFTEQWICGKNHIPALTGLVCSLLCLVVFGSEHLKEKRESLEKSRFEKA